MTSITVKALSAGLSHLFLQDSTGTQIAFITDTGQLWCQGINSSMPVYAASLSVAHDNSSIDSSGNTRGASITANGANGISVYNGTTKNSIYYTNRKYYISFTYNKRSYYNE